MNRKDISDGAIVVAFMLAKNLEQKPYFVLGVMFPDASPKVVEAAVARAVDRGLIEFGVSQRFGWVTEKGRCMVME